MILDLIVLGVGIKIILGAVQRSKARSASGAGDGEDDRVENLGGLRWMDGSAPEQWSSRGSSVSSCSRRWGAVVATTAEVGLNVGGSSGLR